MELLRSRNLDLEKFERGFLEPCWKYGGSRSKTLKIQCDEIVAVDLVACCKQISDLIQQVIDSRDEENFLTGSRLRVSFKDIARLTYGAMGIYRHQINILLGTKLVFELSSTETVVVRQSQMSTHRHRKRVITQKSTVTVSKRPRMCEPDLLGESVREYYASMLDESVNVPQIESPQKLTQEFDDTIETPRICSISTSYQALTITEELEIHEDHTFMCPLDGFGETNPDLSIYEELFPRKRSLKRPSTCLNSTEILPNKIPRLEESLEETIDASSDNTIMTKDGLNSVETVEEMNIICETPIPVLMSPLPMYFPFKSNKKLKKGKLIIDKCIEYCKNSLLKHRQKYIDCCQARKITVTVKQPPGADLLLSKLNKTSIFPDLLTQIPISLGVDQMEDESEATLRSIFADELYPDLVKEILGQDLHPLEPLIEIDGAKMEDNNLMEQNNNHNLEQVPTPEEHNNNISALASISTCRENNINQLEVMMDLLTIWRKNPDSTIDASDYINSFPDRLKAALVFSHLLSLVRNKLITISKKPNSNEMDKISLGKESINLIGNIANDAVL
ncbi:uncharacterized protein Dana_GF14579, isoform B [Drosophila ananassae]|uniref:Uncharacterized protein, isoform B n=1 Tax=Drosophila ananassae TaxID=7217 RepID=A0A0P8XVI3_DROAN|nr:uncharacterized protein Dana_GF14579, isoform B [Drosophila ananassae]